MKKNILYTVSVLTLFSAISLAGEKIYVSPDGDDSGTGYLDSPLLSINHALALAQPGDEILLKSGLYFQDIRTQRHGEPGNPVRIIGLSGAVVKGSGKTAIVYIQHSYIELSEFTVDGLVGDGSRLQDYRKKLVYIKGDDVVGVRGVKLLEMDFKNARDECIRMKYFAQNNEIARSRISNCGVEDFQYNGTGKNGEAIYIGTAPEQLFKNPTPEIDESNNNWVHHNIIETFGAECIDVKEGSSFNVIEFNQCGNEKDKNSAGISIRGNNNIVRNNILYQNVGAGVRLGGDTDLDGINNEVYGNQLIDNAFSGLKIMTAPQGKVCNNIFVLEGDQKPVRTKKGIDKDDYISMCDI